MGNFDTISAITENMKSALRSQGLKFTLKSYGDKTSIPASLLPLGEIDYRGESFEYTHGQRAGYVEASFGTSVTLSERSARSLVREQQEWTHKLRAAITVDALNTGALSTSKLVSFVEHGGGNIESNGSFSLLSMEFKVRYREA
jgi:hypothetical protein